jgi:hypothetical protein
MQGILPEIALPDQILVDALAVRWERATMRLHIALTSLDAPAGIRTIRS